MNISSLFLVITLVISTFSISNLTYSVDMVNGYFYSQNISVGDYINVIFEVKSSPNYTNTYVALSFDNYITQIPKITDFYGIKPSNVQYYDLQGLSMGRKQYINLRKPASANVAFISIYNLDNWSRRKNITFDLSISSTNGLICQPCISGSRIVSNSSCICQDCIKGYEGYDCSRQIIYMNKDEIKQINILPYTPKYLRIKDFKTSGQNISMYLKTIYYDGQFASYLNTDVNQNYELTPNNQLTIQYFTGGRDLSITIVKYSFSTSSLNYRYMNVPFDRLNFILSIITGIVSGLLFITLLSIIIIVWRRYRTHQLIDNSLLLPRNLNHLDSQQINLYFPEFKIQQLSHDISSSFIPNFSQNSLFQIKAQQPDNQNKEQKICSICLENIQKDNFLRVTYCIHYFHSECLMSWLKKQSNCPYCRCDFKKQKLQVLYDRVNATSSVKNITGKQLVKAILKANLIIQSNLRED